MAVWAVCADAGRNGATRDNMVKGQITFCPAILTGELIAQEQVKPGEGHLFLWLYIVPQHNNRRDFDFGRRAVHHLVIFCNDVDPVQPRRLDRVLPGPKR